MYEEFKLPMTLKIVIVDHYSDYLKATGKFFRLTNGEHHEAIHHQIKSFESKINHHMKKKYRKSYPPGQVLAINFSFQCFEDGIYYTQGDEAKKKKIFIYILLPVPGRGSL